MNFIELQLPKILEPFIDHICDIKWFVEKTYKRWRLRIVWYFKTTSVQNRITKLYQRLYDEQLQEELREKKMLKEWMEKWIKRYKKKQGK